MKLKFQVRIGLLLLLVEMVLVNVVCQFFGVFYTSRGLDWPTKTIVAVAKLISKVFKVLLEGNVIFMEIKTFYVSHLVVNRKSCSTCWIVIGHHIEVKLLV